jgi:hypothetical protein
VLPAAILKRAVGFIVPNSGPLEIFLPKLIVTLPTPMIIDD